MKPSSDVPNKTKILPFSVLPDVWDCLSPDIRRLLWDGWHYALQLNEIVHRQRRTEAVDETKLAGLVKPTAPLTNSQALRQAHTADDKAARLQATKRKAADKIARLQAQVAHEEKFGR